ncbi:hypothetical protein HDV06_005469 [Boothiomyces sp. JEL0866]|nr:hypothetical protein HDV06_005469 [Boothiomyces sp. JEL0866]
MADNKQPVEMPQQSQVNAYDSQPAYGAPPTYPTQQPPMPQVPVDGSNVGPQVYQQAPAQPQMVVTQVFTENPQPISCPNCKAQGISVTDKSNGAAVWISACVVCLVFWPCAWIPCVIDTCKDTNHRCSNCGMVVGVKKMI